MYFNVLGQGFLVLGNLNRTYDLFERRSSNYSDRPYAPLLVGMYVGSFFSQVGCPHFHLTPRQLVWNGGIAWPLFPTDRGGVATDVFFMTFSIRMLLKSTSPFNST